MACVDGSKCGSAPWLRRPAPRQRRGSCFDVPVMPVFGIDSMGDGAVLLINIGSESLVDDHAVVIARRLISLFGHGHRNDPMLFVAHELDIDPKRPKTIGFRSFLRCGKLI
jgi:hypothetical protein